MSKYNIRKKLSKYNTRKKSQSTILEKKKKSQSTTLGKKKKSNYIRKKCWSTTSEKNEDKVRYNLRHYKNEDKAQNKMWHYKMKANLDVTLENES